MKKLMSLTMLVLFVCCASFAYADYLYDEAVDGDLPHPNAAFVIPFGAPNPNIITFTMDLMSDGWIVEIDPGETLESFTLIEFTPPNDPAYTASFHMHDGPLVTDPVLGTPYASFGYEMLGVDFLAHFGIGPLGEGQYLFNFWHDNSGGAFPTMMFDISITNGGVSVETTTLGAIKDLYR